MSAQEESKQKTLGNPYDINGQYFNPDMYLQKMLKENSLKQVMDQETEIVRDTQSLHSEMQTLVYENYNKFISATDTIKKIINYSNQLNFQESTFAVKLVEDHISL